MARILTPLKDVCLSGMATLVLLGVLFGPFLMVSLSRMWAGN
jgi:hypothetical protein